MPPHAAAVARLRAYTLWEAVQGETSEEAAAELVRLEARAMRESWPEVAFLSAAGQVVHAVVRGGAEAARPAADALVVRAEALHAPALVGIALALRAVVAAASGDSGAALADAGRAVVLAEDLSQPALDRCTALVVSAAAYNALSLWELVDELYDQASALAEACEEPLMQPAVVTNRMLVRLEWATALLELGDERGALDLLRRAATAAGSALEVALPPLWACDARAGRDLVALVLAVVGPGGGVPVDVADRFAALDAHRPFLRDGGDVEMLPLLDAFGALCLVRLGRAEEALARLDGTGPASASSGSRSFTAWVRAEALAGDDVDPSVAAHRAYGVAVSRARWAARRAVLAAAGSTIAAQRLSAEHADLTRDVLLDPLTGLANRRRFDQWLTAVPQHDRATALLLIDLDDFKSVNDQHGHAVGDDALRRVGRLVAQHVRPHDLAIRLGGDEFAIVLVDDPDDPAPPSGRTPAALRATAVERSRVISEAVERTDWDRITPGLVVRLSVGAEVAVLGPGDPAAADRLYRLADLALYEAKAGLSAATG